MPKVKDIGGVSERERNPVPVLLFVRELGSGGIERDVAKLAKALPRQRFTPYVATYNAAGPRFEELTDAGVPILHVPLASIKSPSALYQAVRFGWFLLRKGIRVVHAWDASAVFAVPIARLLRRPAVLSSMLGSRKLLDADSRHRLQFTDRLVDAVVVNCEAMRKHLVGDCGVPASKIELCYNGVDISEFRPDQEPRPPELEGALLVIGTVCVLRVEKALQLLITAFARVRAPGMKLLIVGSGPELPKLRSQAETLGLSQVTIFVPAVRAVARYLHAIDIFVSSSYSEAFSNSILEAMACGCCVVGSRVGGTPELIEDGVRGLLFESGNVDELADKLSQLIASPTWRKELARNAAEFAQTRLNMDIAVKTMMGIYERILQSKNTRGSRARIQ
jgi:glycosyltransferase involved in cell wall biosynthesis